MVRGYNIAGLHGPRETLNVTVYGRSDNQPVLSRGAVETEAPPRV